MKNQYTIRKYTNQVHISKPYDIVWHNYNTNTLHFMPGVVFASVDQAETAILKLQGKQINPRIWPTDGEIPQEARQTA